MNNNINSNLRKYLKGHELKYVSKSCNIPISTLHGWINSATPSLRSLKQLERLCDHLDITLDQLLLGRKFESPESEIITSTIFRDGSSKYKITVEKIST